MPALVNARCRVLKGQVRRANGGLFYRSAGEFDEALDYLLTHQAERDALGRQGLAYVEREYRWPTVLARVERCWPLSDLGQWARSLPGRYRSRRPSHGTTVPRRRPYGIGGGVTGFRLPRTATSAAPRPTVQAVHSMSQPSAAQHPEQRTGPRSHRDGIRDQRHGGDERKANQQIRVSARATRLPRVRAAANRCWPPPPRNPPPTAVPPRR